MNMHHCFWFRKETDWPIVEQDKVKQESQTDNPKRKKGRTRESSAD